jgi:DNA-binding response OmpR family regulator
LPEYLFLHKNKILKRGEILKDLRGENDYFLGRSLDVISRLRKHLGASMKIVIRVYRVGVYISGREVS